MQRSAVSRKWAELGAILLAIVAIPACVTVEYVRPASRIETRPGTAVVFTRIRFMDDGREWYPWDPSFVDILLDIERHRHFWLRQLDRHAASPELQPDNDGSLALRLAPGDYALIGSDENFADVDSTARFEVVALLRVPQDHVVLYAGDLVLVMRYREGWSAVTRWLGEPVVEHEPLATATARIEARYGSLPVPLEATSWCIGPGVPSFADPGGPAKALELLGRGCPQSQ